MLSVFDKVIENAVPVEVHDDMYKGTIREDKQLDAVYVFLSAFEINNEIIPVELLVKSFVGKENTLYVTATLGNIKKEENSVSTVAPEKIKGSTVQPFSIYSVPQVIKNIKPQFGEFIKYIPDGLLTDEQIDAKIAALLKQQEKIEQLKKGVRGGTEYSRVLNQNAEDEIETIKYSRILNGSFEQNVSDVLAMGEDEALQNKQEANIISVVEHTPDVILENISDAEDLPIIIRFDALYLAARKEGVLSGHYHNLGEEIVSKLPEFISDPDAIIRLQNGRINLLTQIKTNKGNTGIISIELNTVQDINDKFNKYNLVVTFTPGKDNYIRNLINNATAVEYKKDDLPQVNPQLYKWLTIFNGKSSNNNISEADEKSKTQNEENSRFLNQNNDTLAIYKVMDDSEREEILRKSNVAIYKAQDENFKNIDNIDTFRTNIKSAVEKPLKKLAKKYSLFRSYNISNPKIDFGFSISNLKKALFVQSENKETFENYAKMLSVLDKIIENAVLIEVHDDMYKGTPREDKQLDGVYVFLSGFEINDEIIPIELLVKSFVDKENTLYVTATLGSIKKEENSVIAVAPKKERGSTARLFSTYSVPQIIKNIKPQFGEFIKYIPDGLLTDEQIDAKIAALLKQQKKIEQLKKGVRGGTEYSRVLNQNALEYVDRLKSGSRQQWEKIDILTGLAENAQGPEISDAALRKIARKYDFSEKNRAEIRQMAERLKTASGMLDTAANIDTVLYGLYMIARNEYENAGHYEDFDDVSARFREEFRTNGKMISVYMPTDIYNTVAEYYGGRAAFRRAMFGKMNVTDNTSKGGIGLDEFYDSLVKGNYGLEETTDPSTQINNMLALYNSDTKYWVDDSYAFTMQGESLEERATDTAFNMLVDLLTAGKKDKQTKAAIERINALQEEIKTARAEGIQSIITMADAELQRKLDELSKSGKDTVAIEIERERLKNENRIKW